jgi:hypothetical protein
MFSNKFGIEIEFTGITRSKAAETVAEYFSSNVRRTHDGYDTHCIAMADGRTWKIVSDASINCQRKDGSRTVSAGRDYSVELVSPILTYYEDIKTVQELVRRLRKAGGFVNKSCGIHIHLDGSNHTPRSIRNFVNIIASKNDLLYKSLQIEPARMHYCKKMDARLVERMNQVKPKTFDAIKEIWYEGYRHENRLAHYHNSRYHFLNLHSFFQGNRTVELRGFNSTLKHAGVIRSYIVLALGLNHQALTQKSASSRKVQEENEKFAMRVYLNRIGFIGDEFKSCREHLYLHLNGNAAWRYGRDRRKDRNQEGDGENE